jgi:hypothetical protein
VRRSTISTRRPALARSYAAEHPAGPAPAISTSKSDIGEILRGKLPGIGSHRCDISPARLLDRFGLSQLIILRKSLRKSPRKSALKLLPHLGWILNDSTPRHVDAKAVGLLRHDDVEINEMCRIRKAIRVAGRIRTLYTGSARSLRPAAEICVYYTKK